MLSSNQSVCVFVCDVLTLSCRWVYVINGYVEVTFGHIHEYIHLVILDIQ